MGVLALRLPVWRMRRAASRVFPSKGVHSPPPLPRPPRGGGSGPSSGAPPHTFCATAAPIPDATALAKAPQAMSIRVMFQDQVLSTAWQVRS